MEIKGWSCMRESDTASVLRSAQAATLCYQRPDDDTQGIGQHVVR